VIVYAVILMSDGALLTFDGERPKAFASRDAAQEALGESVRECLARNLTWSAENLGIAELELVGPATSTGSL